MFRGVGYVCIVFHKDTKVYKVGSSDDVERKFEELGVGDSTELVKSYWVINHRSVAENCIKKFADKRIPKSEYYQLDDKDLEELKRILKEDESRTTLISRQESDARRIERLRSYREKYYKSSEFKRFIMRNDKKFNSAFGCGFSLLILSPLLAFAVIILNAYGISRYFLLLPIFGLFILGLWGTNKDDKRNQEELLGDEEDVIRKDIETWKSIDAKTDAYKKKNEK